MKHNNNLPNNQFNKGSMKYKMWFDQPARKEKRRKLRKIHREKVFPRPIEKLRPIVRCTTVRYNRKERLGRGFTLNELQSAGITLKNAISIGISIDKRRKNRNEESFNQNVERLKEYLNKIIIYDSKKDAIQKSAIQHKGIIMPIQKKIPEIKTISIDNLSQFKV